MASSILTTHDAPAAPPRQPKLKLKPKLELELELPLRSSSALLISLSAIRAMPLAAIGALLYTQPCSRCPHRCSSKLPSLTARVSILRTTRRPKMLTRLHSPWPLGCSSQPSWIAIVQRRYYTVCPCRCARCPLNLFVRVVRRGMATAAVR
jgi:hypothetical protein